MQDHKIKGNIAKTVECLGDRSPPNVAFVGKIRHVFCKINWSNQWMGISSNENFSLGLTNPGLHGIELPFVIKIQFFTSILKALMIYIPMLKLEQDFKHTRCLIISLKKPKGCV